MNGKNGQNSTKKNTRAVGKDCAYIAVFVALTIAAQLCLSFLPGVEVVTVLFVAFSFVFGCRKGIAAATAFASLYVTASAAGITQASISCFVITSAVVYEHNFSISVLSVVI